MSTKKFLRFFLIVIGITAVLVLVGGLVQPRDVTVTRSVTISAPTDTVWAKVVHFKQWPG